MKPRNALSMILPAVDANGDVDRSLLHRDARIPHPPSIDHSPHLISSYDRDVPCPDGRHLWDALVAYGDVRYDQDENEHVPFRLALTCVRCGLIQQLAGVTDEQNCRTHGRIDPAPLQVGELLAQQVNRREQFVGWTEWTVHSADRGLVGSMANAVGLRGRRFVSGRLHEFLDAPVEAPTAQACLRKLARLQADRSARSGG